jgi:hypothetical protein
MTKRKPYTAAERSLANRLYTAALARGQVKPPRGLGALATSNGIVMSFGCSRTTSLDYLGDARRMLRQRQAARPTGRVSVRGRPTPSLRGPIRLRPR